MIGNVVKLYGGDSIKIKPYLFFQNHNLINISDNGCIVELGEGAFYEAGNVTFSLDYLKKADKYAFTSTTCIEYNFPSLEEIGDHCFYYTIYAKRFIFNNLLRILDDSTFAFSPVEVLYFPKLTNMGSSVAYNYIFYQVAGHTVSLTIPSALMTCNGGNPDGDIQNLIDNNTVTIYDPEGSQIYPI